MPSQVSDLDGFRSLDVEQKLRAITTLKSNDAATLPYVLEAMADSEWRVRQSGVDGMVSAAPFCNAVDQVISALQSSHNGFLRDSATEALVRLGTNAVVPLLGKVRACDPYLKKLIMDILGAIGDCRAVPVCLSLMSETDENVAVSAIKALGKLKDDRAVEPLIAELRQDHRPLAQFSAVTTLQELGDGRAIEPLIAVLGRTSFEPAVLEALGHIGDSRVLNPLVQALRLGSVHVRHTAVHALIRLHHRMPADTRTKIVCRLREIYENDTARYLLACVHEGQHSVKRNAITVMGWMGDVNAIDALVAVFDESCKEEIVTAFALMQREAVPRLLDHLRHAPDELREGIVRALGEIGDRKAVHGLVLLAADSNGRVRQSVAGALGRLGDPMGVRPLLRLLEDSDSNVQEAAYHALIHFKGQTLIDRLMDFVGNAQPALHCYAAKLLGLFKAEQAKACLIQDLKNPDPTIRRTAIVALNMFGVDVEEICRTAVADEAPSVRLEAVRILAERQESFGEALLLPLLHDPVYEIRAEVIRVLGERRNPALIEMVLPFVSDQPKVITIAACEALVNLHARQAEKALANLLTSTDHEVRQAAVTALGSLAGVDVVDAVLPLLNDPCWNVRAATVVTLGKINATSMLGRLHEMAQGDPDHLVRESARFVLDQLAVSAERAA